MMSKPLNDIQTQPLVFCHSNGELTDILSKERSVFYLYTSGYPLSLVISSHFTVFTVLPFLECSMARLLGNAVLSDWLFHLIMCSAFSMSSHSFVVVLTLFGIISDAQPLRGLAPTHLRS